MSDIPVMLQFLKKARRPSPRAALCYKGTQAVVAFAEPLADGRSRLRIESLTVDPEHAEGIQDAVRAALPERVSITSVLQDDDYRLQLLELPDVPKAERRDALRWQSREIADLPADEAVADYLPIPHTGKGQSRDQGYAIFAARSVVDWYGNLATDRRGDHRVIVPEAALHALASSLPEDAHGVALLHFGRTSGCLVISRESVLYQVRRLALGTERIESVRGDEFASQELIAGLALEVQRSLDYYESQYDCQPVSNLVMTAFGDSAWVQDRLQDDLGISVSVYSPPDSFELDDVQPESLSRGAAIAFGAVLDSLNTDPESNNPGLNLRPAKVKAAVPAFSSRFLALAAGVSALAMGLLGYFASSQVANLKAEIEFSNRQEELAAQHLTEAVETIRRAVGAENLIVRQQNLQLEVRQKQAMIQLLESYELGETSGFSDHLAYLSNNDTDRIWLTDITLNADSRETFLAGYAFRAEDIPVYVAALTSAGPFATQGFQAFRIDAASNNGEPVSFAMSGGAVLPNDEELFE